MCLHHGSSMQGRIDAFKSLLKVEKKVPVLVCRYQGCIFFPTTSFMREDEVDNVLSVEDALKKCKEADSVLLGAVGGPKWDSVAPEIRPEK